MKKTIFKCITFLIIFSVTTGCQREEFMDLSGFVNNFYTNEIALSINDFYVEKSDTKGNIYYAFPQKDKSMTMIKLICDETNKISEMRIFLPKTDENENTKEITENDIRLFLSVAEASLCAFTQCNAEDAEKLLGEMMLYDKNTYNTEGELTKERNKFCYIYLSAFLGSELIVYNTYLSEPEKTEKPVSKHLYGEAVTTRSDRDSLE